MFPSVQKLQRHISALHELLVYTYVFALFIFSNSFNVISPQIKCCCMGLMFGGHPKLLIKLMRNKTKHFVADFFAILADFADYFANFKSRKINKMSELLLL